MSVNMAGRGPTRVRAEIYRRNTQYTPSPEDYNAAVKEVDKTLRARGMINILSAKDKQPALQGGFVHATVNAYWGRHGGVVVRRYLGLDSDLEVTVTTDEPLFEAGVLT